MFLEEVAFVLVQAAQMDGKSPSQSLQQLQQACPAAKSLICQMVLKDPCKRITAAQALQHEFCLMDMN